MTSIQHFKILDVRTKLAIVVFNEERGVQSILINFSNKSKRLLDENVSEPYFNSSIAFHGNVYILHEDEDSNYIYEYQFDSHSLADE